MQPPSPLTTEGHTPLSTSLVLLFSHKFITGPFYPTHPPKMTPPLLCKILLQRGYQGAQVTHSAPLLCSLLLKTLSITHTLPKVCLTGFTSGH